MGEYRGRCLEGSSDFSKNRAGLGGEINLAGKSPRRRRTFHQKKSANPGPGSLPIKKDSGKN